ncbi:hypothetical protein AMTR_s00145p00047310, partial [Amborella trichopoda]
MKTSDRHHLLRLTRRTSDRHRFIPLSCNNIYDLYPKTHLLQQHPVNSPLPPHPKTHLLQQRPVSCPPLPPHPKPNSSASSHHHKASFAQVASSFKPSTTSPPSPPLPSSDFSSSSGSSPYLPFCIYSPPEETTRNRSKLLESI